MCHRRQRCTVQRSIGHHSTPLSPEDLAHAGSSGLKISQQGFSPSCGAGSGRAVLRVSVTHPRHCCPAARGPRLAIIQQVSSSRPRAPLAQDFDAPLLQELTMNIGHHTDDCTTEYDTVRVQQQKGGFAHSSCGRPCLGPQRTCHWPRNSTLRCRSRQSQADLRTGTFLTYGLIADT